LLKLQNSNLFQEIDQCKQSNKDLDKENNFLKQELKNYKNHIHKILKIFESLNDYNEISWKQSFDEFRSYLERNFLDKLSDSLFVEEKIIIDKRTPNSMTPNNLFISNSEKKG